MANKKIVIIGAGPTGLGAKRQAFVCSAKAGAWKRQLFEASAAEIESTWGGLMCEIGYELAVSSLVDASLVHAGMERG
jgi:protoporphyrinogen oxidase